MATNDIYLTEAQALDSLDIWTWAQSKLPKSPISQLLQNLDWQTVYTIEKNERKFETLIKERPFLMAQYRVQAAYLVQLSAQTHKYDPKLIREIEQGLKMTVLLKKIYEHLNEPDDVMRAKIDIAILDTILYRIKHPHARPASTIPQCNVGFSHQLRAIHANSNLSRLTAIRIRRFILACIGFQTFLSWRPTVAQVEYFTAPFFLYLGWLFFFPRFFLNLSTLIKKSFFSPENHLPWHLKFEAYLNLHRRLYELWTDTAWFTSGILLCFVLFGPLVVWRPVAVIAVQISDTVMMMTRSFFEIRRLLILKKEYQEGPQNPGYLHALEERIAFEKKVSYLAITNNLLMTIALLGILPMVSALNPFIPVLGAALGILTTLRFYTYNAANESQQPRTNLNILLKNYDEKASSAPASAPPNLVMNRLAAPAVLVLTPLIFVSYAINPLLTGLFCVSLVLSAIRQAQQPTKIQQNKKNYETTMSHHFFKPEQAVDKPVQPQQPNTVARTP